MNFEFMVNGWQDFEYWMDNDRDMADKVRALLKDMSSSPFQGLGKPQPLKFDLKACRFRRISGEHRLVYKVEGSKGMNQKCMILQCRFLFD